MSRKMFRKTEFAEALNIYAAARAESLLEGFREPFVAAMKDRTFVPSETRSMRIPRRYIIVPLAALLAVLLMTFAASANTRQKVLEQLRKIGKDDVSYEFWDDRDDQTVEIELPELSIDLPTGFELKKEGGSPVVSYRYYVNDRTGDAIFFSYGSLNADAFHGFSYVDDIQYIKINGMDADLYPHNDRSSQCNIFWIDKTLNVCITIDTTLSEEILIELAESVYKQPTYIGD